MREIVRESEISMSTRESSLSNQANDDVVIDRGGCTVFGESVCPTLIRGYYKMVGNTQDGMTIVILGEDG